MLICSHISHAAAGGEAESPSDGASREVLRRILHEHVRLQPLVRLLFLALAVLALLTDFVLALTVIWHHNAPSKLFGVAFALTYWVACYKLLYRMSDALWPPTTTQQRGREVPQQWGREVPQQLGMGSDGEREVRGERQGVMAGGGMASPSSLTLLVNSWIPCTPCAGCPILYDKPDSPQRRVH